MKRPRVKAADCSDEKLLRIAKRCGLLIVTSKRHYKLRPADGRSDTIAMIPRHRRLKRETVRYIVARMNEYGCRVECA